MRDAKEWFDAGKTLEAESVDARAREIVSQNIVRKHNGRSVTGKRLQLKGTTSAEIKAGPAPGYVRKPHQRLRLMDIGDVLRAEKIVADVDKVRFRSVTRATHNIQRRYLHGNVFCMITIFFNVRIILTKISKTYTSVAVR